MEALIMYPETQEQLIALKAFAKAFKIKFEIKKSPYNHRFVKMVLENYKLAKKGKAITLDPNRSLWENIM